MRIGVTGATGFLGRYIVNTLVAAGHRCTCWHRPTSDLSGFEGPPGSIAWISGSLGDDRAAQELVEGQDAVVHAALDHPSGSFRGSEGDVIPFVEKNLVGTLKLVEAARSARVGRFVFISTCAVHEIILPDRPLDETHPLWTTHHYGAHKAAIEAFIGSYGFGRGYEICALRPTGIYGLARPAQKSKWFDLVGAVARGETVTCRRGGKEVHAVDVARAVEILLTAPGIAGKAYNCYDMYISEYHVAEMAARLSGSSATIHGESPRPKHEIETGKIRSLGVTFGGEPLLERTVTEILSALGRH